MTVTVEDIESKMLDLPQADCPVVHHFSPGLYIRELRMFKGTLAIGHYQKTEHMNLFLEGKVLMLDKDGAKTEFSAPMLFVGKPGRKMGYVLEDVVWLNIYATEETDIEKLERTYLDKSKTWENHNSTKALQKQEDVEDYQKLLTEYGLSEDIVRNQSENKDDQTAMPSGSFKIKIDKSGIEGRGVFATAGIELGEIVAPARINGQRTPVGRYVNHSINPNAEMIQIGNDIYLKSICKITGCLGGLNGQEITTNYRKNLKLIGVKSCQELQQR